MSILPTTDIPPPETQRSRHADFVPAERNNAAHTSVASGFDFKTWHRPPAAYSHCPFWFWNDDLDDDEIVRQIGEFQKRGVEAFVLHPRIGLPRTLGWLSPRLFRFMRTALREAWKRGMWVFLYDEGMYPSGSAGGLVVARNPAFQVRGLVCEERKNDDRNASLVAYVRRADGRNAFIYDRPVDAVVRGLHYIGDETDAAHLGEEEPIAADLLNPAAVRCFIELVYERFHAELGEYFGTVVKGIFTDEPNPLSRLRQAAVVPGTTGILEHVNAHLGYDFTPHLPALWFDDEPDASRHRRAYADAIAARLDETYYVPLSRWCADHGIALTGHPAEPDDIGHLRHLQIPGQDIVWRHILPATPTALEGPPSTMAKAAASVKFHYKRTCNLNEFAGAYGESLTFRELRWLASWLLIRGCDMLVPHAFYYSMRGPRRDERPPDVGPNSAWWNNGYKEWEAMTRRLCWLNATFVPVCEVAILGRATELPWRAAKTCFENQIDFHYIEPRDLASNRARVDAEGFLRVGPGRYTTLIVETGYEDIPLPSGTPVLRWNASPPPPPSLLATLPRTLLADSPAPGLRVRHLLNETGNHIFLLFNEGETSLASRITLPLAQPALLLDPVSGTQKPWDASRPLTLGAHEFVALLTPPNPF
ncbi:hypothetical protein [Geminisphaera colitermitum]|uniref:hypothetical protein n=1 Tax=Geminisphaera colitermitum TaxID=1148786 RepID=UPI000694A485|nr:hypothetical protein [Geminisphaera colitermitum]